MTHYKSNRLVFGPVDSGGDPGPQPPQEYTPQVIEQGFGLGEILGRELTAERFAGAHGLGLAGAIGHNIGVAYAGVGFDSVSRRLLDRGLGCNVKIDFSAISGATNADLQTIFAEAGIGFSEIAAFLRDISPPAQGRVRFNEQAGAFLAVVKAGGEAEAGEVGFSVLAGAAIADSTTAGATVGIGLDESATRINDLFEVGAVVGLGLSEIAAKLSEHSPSASAGLGLGESPGYIQTQNPPNISAGMGFGEVAGGLNYSAFVRANQGRLAYAYYATITGGADGLEDYAFPAVKSFQTRMRSGTPSYLSIVLPYNTDVLSAINARPSGEIFVEMAAGLPGYEPIREELVRVDFDSVRTDEGADSKSITLTGYKTRTYTTGTTALQDVMTRAMESDGLLRFRCATIDFFLRPGHSASYGGETITVDTVSCTVGPNLQYMDVSE